MRLDDDARRPGEPLDDADPGGPAYDPEERRRRRGWALIAAALAIVVVLAASPAPYVIERPGPVYNTLGTAGALGSGGDGSAQGEDEPLIAVTGHDVYPATGSLDLLTVSSYGNPNALPGWTDVIAAWFSPREAAVPVDSVFPPQLSVAERNARAQQQMVDSQSDAIAAALTELGYDVEPVVEVVYVEESGPAHGVLEDGDAIESVDGAPVAGIASLRAAIDANGTGRDARIGIRRGDDSLTVAVRPRRGDAGPRLGIEVRMRYTFPFSVTIRLDDVGGPSAGMMFALGIVDKLTPGAITEGARIAGTGTIDSEGNVGAIGGIRQKLFAARDAGARWFLAPAANCGEVRGHVPEGLRVVAVRDLGEAVAAVTAIGQRAGLNGLPDCGAG